MRIVLQGIDEANSLSVAHLRLREDQRGFVTPPEGVLARAYA